MDLNAPENKAIREEVELKTEETNLSQKVLVCVDLRTEIRYKTNAKCITKSIYAIYRQRRSK